LVIGTPDAVDNAIQEALKVVTRSSGSDTIVLDVGLHADLELVICGLALPLVPLSEVVSSYFYDLLPDGRWVTRSDRSVLRVEVSSSGVRLQALSVGVQVNGRGISSGDSVMLKNGFKVSTSGGTQEFRVFGGSYAGVLLSDTGMRLGVVANQKAELGREPNHPGLAFPDRRGQDNIRWCPGPRAAKARAGGFTLDRALAGRHQASLEFIDEGTINITSLHPRCPTYVVRSGSGQFQHVEPRQTRQLEMGDLVIAGTTIVGVRAPE
jgi:hypothetical protein